MERCYHLHDLHFAVGLAGVDVAAVGDQELDELAGRRGRKQRRVVLLGEHEGLGDDVRKMFFFINDAACLSLVNYLSLANI